MRRLMLGPILSGSALSRCSPSSNRYVISESKELSKLVPIVFESMVTICFDIGTHRSNPLHSADSLSRFANSPSPSLHNPAAVDQRPPARAVVDILHQQHAAAVDLLPTPATTLMLSLIDPAAASAVGRRLSFSQPPASLQPSSVLLPSIQASNSSRRPSIKQIEESKRQQPPRIERPSEKAMDGRAAAKRSSSQNGPQPGGELHFAGLVAFGSVLIICLFGVFVSLTLFTIS
ncbi:hypothetical protein LINPERPRIM_LOCUS41699 [Linum perenne]